jgi:hypothetical protein
MYLTSERKCQVSFRPELLLMPTRTFDCIKFEEIDLGVIGSHRVIRGYWRIFANGKAMNCNECINGKYHQLFIYEDSLDIQMKETGEYSVISSPKGVNVRISDNQGIILVQIWKWESQQCNL